MKTYNVRPDDLWDPSVTKEERNFWLDFDRNGGSMPGMADPPASMLDLKETYGITPAMPTRKKIQRLYLIFQLNHEEIAAVLQVDEDGVAKECAAIDKGSLSKGGALSPAEQVKARGQAITELEMSKAEADAKYNTTQDLKWFNASKDLSMRILDMRGLDKDRQASEDGTDFVSRITDALDRLPEGRLAELRLVLGV